MNKIAECPRCGIEAKLNKTSFSDQATAALVVWGEMEAEQIGQAICRDCYSELRETLIDRSDELSQTEAQSKLGSKAG